MRSLFFKISATFLVILLLLGVAYIWITTDSADRYMQEANQRLNASLAEHVVHEIQPLKNGVVDTTGLDKIMHSMMVINPDVEVYLLDNEGMILAYVAPYKKVKLEGVDLNPIYEYLAEDETNLERCIFGDDPRNPGRKKVFSVAEIVENDQVLGYVYVILVSEEYDSATSFVFSNYILRVGVFTFFVTLLLALAIGVILIYYLTKNLNNIISTVKRFKEGDPDARMPVDGSRELRELALTFNDMADTLEQNIEELKSVENLRRELIANVSHDLRTPLAIMRGYVETLMMKGSKLDADQKQKYLETVMNSNLKLEKLVADLFEYAKLEARQITPNTEPFLINELAQDIVAKYQMLGEQKNQSIGFQQEDGLPMVAGDIALLDRVFQNLLDNAIKFTPEGGKIEIALSKDPKGVRVEVADNGPGIPKEELPFVFDRYHKAGQANGSGAGLGLAIVKKILEIHGSKIEVQSTYGQGTKFSFVLGRV
jgi:signal transduction histidine kinase